MEKYSIFADLTIINVYSQIDYTVLFFVYTYYLYIEAVTFLDNITHNNV